MGSGNPLLDAMYRALQIQPCRCVLDKVWAKDGTRPVLHRCQRCTLIQQYEEDFKPKKEPT